MTTHSASEVKSLQESALEHLWVYLREPSDMAERGDPLLQPVLSSNPCPRLGLPAIGPWGARLYLTERPFGWRLGWYLR